MTGNACKYKTHPVLTLIYNCQSPVLHTPLLFVLSDTTSQPRLINTIALSREKHEISLDNVLPHHHLHHHA